MKLNPQTDRLRREAKWRAGIARARLARGYIEFPCFSPPVETDDPPYGARNRRGKLLDAFDAYKEWRGQ